MPKAVEGLSERRDLDALRPSAGKRKRKEPSKGDPAPRKPSKKVSNIDEQGERANVRQNTPPKGLRNKR
jgi:hypothetical protein